jgi:hypothetical protein
MENIEVQPGQKVMFPRGKVSLLRKETRQSEVSAGKNEITTRFLLAKVRI